MSTTMGRTMAVSLITLLAAFLIAAPAAAGVDDRPGQTRLETRTAMHDANGLAQVQIATGRYLDITRATADGFTPFASDEDSVWACTSDSGRRPGTRLVGALDSRLDPARPEALVYGLSAEGQARLVAVEYIVPVMFVEDALGNVVTAPEVFGQPLRKHTMLPIYALRAWIWAENPLGTFAEVNPKVSDCLPV